MTNEDRWLVNYDALKQWTQVHGHFPNRARVEGRGLLNWYKYNAKLIKQGKLSPERVLMIHELEELRSGEHTGGRRPKADYLFGMDMDLLLARVISPLEMLKNGELGE